MDASFLRDFLQAYDQYATESKARAQQLAAKDVDSTEISRPVNLKFCVEAEWVESVIALNFLDPFLKYDDVTYERSRKDLDDEIIESKEVVSLDVLDDLAAKELHINTADSNAQSRNEDLFVAYRMILCRNVLF